MIDDSVLLVIDPRIIGYYKTLLINQESTFHENNLLTSSSYLSSFNIDANNDIYGNYRNNDTYVNHRHYFYTGSNIYTIVYNNI